MRLRRHGVIVMMLGSAVWLTACDSLRSDFEGVYQIDEWTENLASCDAAGDSILDQQTETMVFAEVQSLYGAEYLAVVPCADVGGCQTAAAEEDSLLVFFSGYVFDQGNDEAGWTGASTTWTTDGGGTCTGSATRYTLAGGSQSIAIGIRTSDAPAYPAMPTEDDPDGCDYKDLLEATEDQPCTRLEALHAVFTADLL